MTTNFHPPTPASERIIAGRYRLERVLKQAGRRESFVAQDLTGGSRVVLRMTPAALATPVEARLAHEAAILAGLKAPQLSPLLDFGHADDRFFWVRPFIGGESLAARTTGPWPIDDALAIACRVLEALRALHESGVLCRNLSPTNLIVPAGQSPAALVFADCGLACSLTGDDEAQQKSVEDVLYVSPEQAGSLDCEIGPPADLYSAGAILFELLAGHPPYRGTTVGATLLQHMT
ncbi:MAG: protein kinase, partial [Pirellulaceae bacterium]|nr:protein kinase [Pirellulaceae bacterium]